MRKQIYLFFVLLFSVLACKSGSDETLKINSNSEEVLQNTEIEDVLSVGEVESSEEKEDSLLRTTRSLDVKQSKPISIEEWQKHSEKLQEKEAKEHTKKY